MRTCQRLIAPQWPTFAAFLVLVSMDLPSLLQAEGAPNRDAALAKCLKILAYGDINPSSKPCKSDAVVALGLLGDETVVPVLIEHLENEENSQLRLEIVRALGWIGSKSSVSALEDAAQHDKYLYVRSHAAAALKEITGKEYAYDHTGEKEMRQKVMERIRAAQEAGDKKANQVPLPTPASSTPAAKAPLAPLSGAAGH